MILFFQLVLFEGMTFETEKRTYSFLLWSEYWWKNMRGARIRTVFLLRFGSWDDQRRMQLFKESRVKIKNEFIQPLLSSILHPALRYDKRSAEVTRKVIQLFFSSLQPFLHRVPQTHIKNKTSIFTLVLFKVFFFTNSI
jgi:hypothetical protein